MKHMKRVLTLLAAVMALSICTGTAEGYAPGADGPGDAYVSSATLFVYFGDPYTAARMADTFQAVAESMRVTYETVYELSAGYPGITPGFVAESLSLRAVTETGIIELSCTTEDAQMSYDICETAVNLLQTVLCEILDGAQVSIIDHAGPSERIPRTVTYTASGTIYVTAESGSHEKRAETCAVIIRSGKVLDAAVERLTPIYPGLSAPDVSSALSIVSVAGTNVLRISCTTDDPRKSMDLCNAVLDAAPAEIIRVTGAGSVEVIDYAPLPEDPNAGVPTLDP